MLHPGPRHCLVAEINYAGALIQTPATTFSWLRELILASTA